jgi:hypothetical protein
MNEKDQVLAEAHGKLIDLLSDIFGLLKGDRIEPKKIPFSQMALQMGYSERHFNDLIHQNTDSLASYDRAIVSAKTLQENKKMKDQRRILYAIIGFLFTAVVILFVMLVSPSRHTNDSEALSYSTSEHRLTGNQLKAVFDIYSDAIRYRLTNQAILFHSSLKNGIYGDSINHYSKLTKEGIDGIVSYYRSKLELAALKVETGDYLYDLVRDSSINNVDKNYQQIEAALRNTKMDSHQVSFFVEQQIEQEQTLNWKRINSFIDSNGSGSE